MMLAWEVWPVRACLMFAGIVAIKGDDQLKIECNRNDAWTQSTVEGSVQIAKW
jgi:hypothetical protein